MPLVIFSGICVVGDADLSEAGWKLYSQNVCGVNTKIIKAPTRWLSSLHVDQILRVVPKKQKAPCDFAVLVASPKKAIALFTRQASDPAFEFPGMTKSEFDHRLTRQPGAGTLCTILRESEDSKKYNYKFPETRFTDANHSNGKIQRGTFLSHMVNINHGNGFFCPELSNSDLLRALNLDPTLKELNELVQQKLNLFKKDLRLALQTSLPQCKIEIIDIPELFTGAILIDPQGKREAAPGFENSGYEVFPSPLNSLVVGNKVIFPEPYSPTIKNYLRTTMQGVGVNADFVDTLNTLTLSESLGNIHCATQTLRYCTP